MKFLNPCEWENTNFETTMGSLPIRKYLGKGKSGYAYLTEFENQLLILKFMHDELCSYYSFGAGNKVELEVGAYHKLEECGIRMSKLITFETEKNYLVKEFIDGPTATTLIADNKITDSIIEQLFEMYYLVRDKGMNIDYFPSNFILKEDQLYYIDYELNPYDLKWDLLNWGLYYWANRAGFKEFLKTGNILQINEAADTGKPLKIPFEEKVSYWRQMFSI